VSLRRRQVLSSRSKETPGTSSITMNENPEASATLWMAVTFAWSEMAASARASRATSKGSRRTLIATRRSSFVSNASYTAPAPPDPRHLPMAYWPRTSGGRGMRGGAHLRGLTGIGSGAELCHLRLDFGCIAGEPPLQLSDVELGKDPVAALEGLGDGSGDPGRHVGRALRRELGRAVLRPSHVSSSWGRSTLPSRASSSSRTRAILSRARCRRFRAASSRMPSRIPTSSWESAS
jgi:hypothetical protein